jgi:hypothetical protein
MEQNQNSGTGNQEGANFNKEEQEKAIAGMTGENKKQNENAPLSTQGSSEELEENLGGTTNLRLEDLKKEGDAGLDDANPVSGQ